VLVTEVEGDGVVIRYDDPGHTATHVGVWAHLQLGDVAMRKVEDGWEVRLSDLPVDRLEYLIDVDGVLQPDPANPRRAPGPFGDHSWLPLPTYHEPHWLEIEPCTGERASLTLSRTGAGRIDAEIWSPAEAGAAESLPMLISHDGPEMDAYGALSSYAGAMIASAELPPFRLVLVSPGPRRNQRYAANSRYARALATRLVPALVDAVPTSSSPVLMGQSLGALAALHAVWTSPHMFSGAFLQSGSFFTVDLDPQESGFEHWREVTGFVAGIHAARQPSPDTPPMTFTCGTAEENFANNRVICDHLAEIGVEAGWGEVRDTHTWTCWRDTLDPHLTALLRRVWT
jgi:enterochelin esterase family protein